MKNNKKNIAAEAENEAEKTVENEAVAAEEEKDAEVAAETATAEAAENASEEKVSEENAENADSSENEPKKKSKMPLIIAICVVAVLAVIGAVLAIFGGKIFGGNGIGDVTEEGGEKTTYSVSIKTAGGMVLPEIDVYVYGDDTLQDMKDLAKTNSEGKVSFTLPEKEGYAIVLASVAKGYQVEESYSFNGTSADIVLTSSLVTDEDLSTAQLGLGDVMYDFTLMTPDEKEIKLSDILKEKELVILNFWYTTCSWCMEEFPLMNELYKEYNEDIEILALNPLEDNNVVKGFINQQNLEFQLTACPSSWSNTFSVSGYPTSVFIDRYGVICIVESGAITSKRPWVCAFDHFTAENYEQKLCTGGIGDLVTQIKPNVEMPASEDIAKAINKGDFKVTYRPETEDENAEYIWPFVIGEKLGQSCIYAPNKGIDDSYAILYADVELKKGQAVGFDYLSSTERLCDVLYVIVDDEDIFQISGTSETEEWKSCYPVVAEEDGTYEVALCLLKDSDGAEGDDTVYIDNFRVVDASEIDVDTYLPRYAAKETDDGYEYATVVYNEEDGYYHVGTAGGPLLLADLMNYTPFNEEQSVQDIVYEGKADKNGVSLYKKEEEGGLGMVKFFSYASNSTIQGICTVNKELAEMLKQVGEVAGFGEENEWLKICKYYEVYGPQGTNLEDPIKGLAPFCAFTTVEGKGVESNKFYYDRAIIPRGLMSEFIPERSGVYRFTSKSDYQEGIEAWIFNEKGENIYTYEHSERMHTDLINCSIVYYMEAGTPYYINMAYWDIYQTGTIYYDVEYLGESIELFRAAAPGYFTYDTNATGDAMYDIITGGITPVLGDDGYYHDKEDGSIIYADFTSLTAIFSRSIIEMIEMGGFDFSKSETDGEILAYLKQNDNDVEKTKEYLKKLWGDEYDMNAESYQLDDIFAGRYHGNGPNLTEDIKAYVALIDKSLTEKDGCVPVDERLAEILQELMSKYTFEDVENSWLKLCFYYDYIGPKN